MSNTCEISLRSPDGKKTARAAQKKYVLGIVILRFVILAVYQIFFCPACYEQADLSERAYGV
jgi:hypothetical protein